MSDEMKKEQPEVHEGVNSGNAPNPRSSRDRRGGRSHNGYGRRPRREGGEQPRRARGDGEEDNQISTALSGDRPEQQKARAGGRTRRGNGGSRSGDGRRGGRDSRVPRGSKQGELGVKSDDERMKLPGDTGDAVPPAEIEDAAVMMPEEPVSSAEAAEPAESAEQAESERLIEVIGVRFKTAGKVYYFAPNGIKAEKDSHVIVETARGVEYGEVAAPNMTVEVSRIVPPLRPVLRAATEADHAHHDENKQREREAFGICEEKIAEHGLDMKLVDVEYTFDNNKLLFYFTSEGRVDFRELVKNLASIFRTRIELRQIGIRDEAKLMGGLGICGRPLCCASFLSDFVQVSIKMAKEQNLSLNSSKISGACGRLMCCLRYESETYEEELRRSPALDSMVRTPDGTGVVTEVNPLAGTVRVRFPENTPPPKLYLRDEVTVIGRAGKAGQTFEGEQTERREKKTEG